jgi:predicted deacylase
MHYLGMISGSVKPASEKSPKFVTMWVPSAPYDGLWYAAKEISDSVAVGDVLGKMQDVFGKALATIHSEREGLILYWLTTVGKQERGIAGCRDISSELTCWHSSPCCRADCLP